jgi:hypothetical protein
MKEGTGAFVDKFRVVCDHSVCTECVIDKLCDTDAFGISKADVKLLEKEYDKIVAAMEKRRAIET